MAQDGLAGFAESPVYSEPYRNALALAAHSGKPLLAKLLSSLQRSLEHQQLHKLAAREQVDVALDLLRQHGEALVERFPTELLGVFTEPARAAKATAASPQKIDFDSLELMALDQVQQGITLARVQQTILLAVDASLVELNTYVCASLGLSSVRPESNPFRPELFLRALQSTMSTCGLPHAVQLDWIQQFGTLLGTELAQLYATLKRQLRTQGVAAVGFAIARGPVASPAAASTGGPAQEVGQKALVLTLDKLNQLLSGDFAEEQGAATSMLPAASHASDIFESTQKLAISAGMALYSEQRPHPGAEIGQEVVRQLVDNVACDPRLLAPVQQLIRSMEPSLLRLALVDPRFLSDKQHPARLLLDEITRLSQAYPSVESAGYPSFWGALKSSVAPLVAGKIDIALDAAPFEQAVTELAQARQPASEQDAVRRQEAMVVLQQAEQRHLLAEKLGQEMAQDAILKNVPQAVVEFLCGPWAQVAAHVQLHDRSGAADPGMVRASMEALAWSAQPELTRKNISKLTRLLPKLLQNLRNGLAMIQYPPAKTEAFFEALFVLHQQAFKPSSTPRSQALTPKVESPPVEAWMPPAEVAITGFMDDLPAPAHEPPETQEIPAQQPSEKSIAIGDWAEILVKGIWVRTQLTWTTPHGSMLLFTDPKDHCLSMSKRNYDKRMQDGSMRLVQTEMVVDEAMDAVLQLAMRNSIDNILI